MKRLAVAFCSFLAVVVATQAVQAQPPLVYQRSFGESGSGDGEFLNPYGVAQAPDGSIYVSDEGLHRVQRFTADGQFILKWGSNGTGSGQFRRPRGLTVDTSGYVYVCDRDNNRIQKFDSLGVYVLEWGTPGSDPGELDSPLDVAVDLLGYVYVIDEKADRVQKFTSTGGFVLEWGTSGTGSGQFDHLISVATDESGYVYVLDRSARGPQVFDDQGNYVDEVGIQGGPLDGAAGIEVGTDYLFISDRTANRVDVHVPVAPWSYLESLEDFDDPKGVAGKWGEHLFVLESQNDRVLRFGPQVVHDPWFPVHTWGGLGTGPGQFTHPSDAAGSGDTLWISDTDNDRIQRFYLPDYSYIDEFGGTGSASGQFRSPHGVILSSAGELYVADSENDRIQVLTPDGTWLRNIASSGTGPGQVNRPYGLDFNGDGNVVVAEGDNDRVQILTPTGSFVALWGSTGTGPGQFNSPHGVAVAANGDIYLADSQNDRIQRFSAAGAYLGEWGETGNGYGQFDTPLGIDIGDSNWVFVADSRNRRVLVFNADGDQIEAVDLSEVPLEPHGVQVSSDGYLHIVDEGGARIHRLDIRNDPPRARDDAACAYLGETKSINVLSNDEEPEGNQFQITDVITTDTRGSVQIASGGYHLDYTAPLAVAGPDSFRYVVRDNLWAADTAWVRVDVSTFPVAVDDTLFVSEDTPTVLAVCANDFDADGDSIYVNHYDATGMLGNVHPHDSPVTSFLYTPPPDFTGTETFEYSIHDGVCEFDPFTATATVMIIVQAVNDPPVAANDAVNTPRDVPVTAHVLANDGDVDGDPLTVTDILHPDPNGLAVIDPGDTTITYTPDPGYIGIDSLDYVVSDGAGGLDTALVAITVNTLPVAREDTVQVVEDTPTQILVRNNDEDDDGHALSIVSVNDDGTLGAVSFTTLMVTYTPAPDYNGPDAFGYTISDGHGGLDSATVTVEVTPVNDPPVAVNDAAATPEDTPVYVDLVANDDDVEGDFLSVTEIVEGGRIGSAIPAGGGITYTPDPDSCGVDSLRCRIADGNGGADTSLVVIAVTCVQDPPVAVSDFLVALKNVTNTLAVLDNDYDVDGERIVAWSVTPPSHGSAVLAPDSLSILYTPAAGYLGPDAFSYCITDGIDVVCADVAVGVGTPDPATSKACLLACPAGDLPSDILIADAEGQPFPGIDVWVDLSRPSVMVNLFTCAYSDTVYHITTDMSGSAALMIDKGGAATSGVRVLVDWGVGPQVLYDSLPLRGLDLNGNGVVDEPDSSFATPYFILAQYHVLLDYDCDGSVGLAESSIFTPHLQNRHSCPSLPPEAVDDAVSTPEDVAGVFAVLDNDSEPDGEPMTVTDVLLAGTLGSVEIDPGGETVTYTPPPDYFGEDSFDYEVRDPTRGVDSARVVVTVTPVNDPPVAEDDSLCVVSEEVTRIWPLVNDHDIDSASLTLESLDLASTAGFATIDQGDTTFSYQSPPGFGGWDTVDYTVSDGSGGSDGGRVHFIVDRPPVAGRDSVTTPEDTPIVVHPLENDTEPDGEPLSIVDAGPALHGLVVMQPGDSTLVYTPNANTYGADSLAYVIAGTGCATDTGVVVVEILPVNDPPEAVVDSLVVAEDSGGGLDVLANDLEPDGDDLSVASIDTTGMVGMVTMTPPAGAFEYQPRPDFHGTTGFSYVVEDGTGEEDTGTVVIKVTPVNDCPIAVPDFVTTPEDVAAVVPVVANDEDVDEESLTVHALLLKGTLGTPEIDPGGTSVTFTPRAEFVGVDAFRYAVRDSTGCSDTTFVQITVTGVDDPPEGVDDVAGTLRNTAVVIHPLDNDVDPEGGVLFLETVEQPLYGLGSTSVEPDGRSVRFVPLPDTTGTDSFVYELSDGINPPVSAAVTVTITDPPDLGHSSHCLVLYPLDGYPLTVTLVDSLLVPVGGVAVTLDLVAVAAADSVVFCESWLTGEFEAVTDENGVAAFEITGGGYARLGASIDLRMPGLETGDLLISYGDSLLVTAVDLTGDLEVGAPDLAAFLTAFAAMDPIADFNCDGMVSAFDNQVMLAAIGMTCANQTGIPGDDPEQEALTFIAPAPNPFRGSTTIRFDCDRGMHSRLEIFDLAGRCVAVPLDEFMETGRHEAIWNGRDRTGKRLPAGIYFLKLTLGEDALQRKVVLLR